LSKDSTLLFLNSTIALYKDAIANNAYIDKTATVQTCFRTNSDVHSLMLFRMIGIEAMREVLDSVTEDFISFLTDVCSVDLEHLICVAHRSDTDLQELWLKSGNASNLVLTDENDDKYSTRWKYGDIYDMEGRGLTLVFNNPAIAPCSDLCSYSCSCRKYMQFGNIIIVKNRITHTEYLDFGFGLERIISYHHENNIFEIRAFKRYIDILTNCNYPIERAESIFNLLRSINKLVASGINYGNKKCGYVLRSLTRNLIFELSAHNAFNLENELAITMEFTRIFHSLRQIGDEFSESREELIRSGIASYLRNLKNSICSARKYLENNSNIGVAEKKKVLRERYGIPEHILERIMGAALPINGKG
jgi:alanyl-tRNA synthetase